MPQLVESYNLPPAPFNGTDSVFVNSTIRQTIQVALAAQNIRLRLSNAFGVNDLNITNVTVSLPVGQKAGIAAQESTTAKTVSFGGSSSITIPDGGLAVSDPIRFPVRDQSTLMIDIYLEQGQQGFSITGHPGSRTTSFMSLGNRIEEQNLTDPSVQSTEHWYFITAVEGQLSSRSSSFCIIGDSITDGRGSTTNANNRWPDLVQKKMQKHRESDGIAILNQAAGGNRVLHAGLGPNVVSRIDRDVIAQSGIKYAMIFEGVNDIGVAAADVPSQTQIGDLLIVAYQQIATRLHAANLSFFGATITPFGTPKTSNYTQPYSNEERERTRQRINTFIKESDIFDAVLDFDRVLRDPAAPSQLQATYDSGDHLHPNEAGYQAIAEYFPLEIFDT